MGLERVDDSGWLVAAAILISGTVAAAGILVSERNRANRERRKLDRRLTKLEVKTRASQRRTDKRLKLLEKGSGRGDG